MIQAIDHPERTHSSPPARMMQWLSALFTDRDWRWDAFVLISYFLTAKLAQYILFALHTSPALIWAPTGIALAAVLLNGNRMWLPVCIAYATAIFTLPGYLTTLPSLIAIFGFTVQPLLGAWGLRTFRSGGSIYETGSVIRFIIASFIIAGIGPLINTLGQIMLQALSASMWLTFSRAWAGGLLGILICTPLIIAWYRNHARPLSRSEGTEAICAFSMLLLSIYLLFWTTLPTSLVFLLIFFLCVILIWIALRFDARAITSALFLLSAMGISGSIIASPTHTPLNQQLFADELFIILLAPIFLIFFTLMEERRQSERALASKVRELETLTERLSDEGRAKNEFIAILAHELRNPLASIVSTIELVKLENQSPEALSMLQRSQEESFAMRRLLDDLLDVARITERKFSVFREDVDISDVIMRSIAATEGLMRERGHALIRELPAEPLLVSVDPIRIEQVVTNLLTNAAKYTPSGGTILVRCTISDDALRLTVQDTGQGIPREKLQHIFLPFRQLNPSGRANNGVGIGLFLAKHVIEMHDGTISAESEGDGSGSMFQVTLPIVSLSRYEPPASAALPGSDQLAVEHLRILIVDDNESAAIGLSKLLQYKGHETQIAHSGPEAIEKHAAFDPHVAILDIGLPGMDGYETARRIRQIAKPGLILIALTGYGQAEDRERSLSAGFDIHLTKPVGISEIEEVIARIWKDRTERAFE